MWASSPATQAVPLPPAPSWTWRAAFWGSIRVSSATPGGSTRAWGWPLSRRCTCWTRIRLGHNQDLFTTEVIAGDWNWIAVSALTGPIEVTAKTRYSQRESLATAEPLADGRVRLRFREPQRAVTPGQFAVLYDGETVVGGGVIEN